MDTSNIDPIVAEGNALIAIKQALDPLGKDATYRVLAWTMQYATGKFRRPDADVTTHIDIRETFATDQEQTDGRE